MAYRPVSSSDSPPRPPSFPNYGKSESHEEVFMGGRTSRGFVVQEEEGGEEGCCGCFGGGSSEKKEGLSATLLDSGETYKLVGPLDTFLRRVYEYHQGHGFVCSVLTELTEILTFLVIFFLILFLSLFIDYDVLLDADDNTVSFWDDVVDIPDGFHPAYAFFALFGLYGVFKIGLFFRNLPLLWEIKVFYSRYLGVNESQLQHISWGKVVELVVEVPGLCLANEDWTELDVVNRILRHENYFVALINREIFDMNLAILKWLPSTGSYFFATESLGFLISWVLQGLWEDRKVGKLYPLVFQAKDDHQILSNLDAGLQRRFRYVGIIALLLLPVTFVYMTVFLILQFGNEYRENPSNIGLRTWSVFAQWKFRELNELPHIFHARLSKGVPPASSYLAHFRSYPFSVIGQFFSFVLGSLIIFLLFLGLWSDNLLSRVEFAPGKSGVWMIGILTIGFAVCRSFVVRQEHGFNPEKALSEVVVHTHYMPSHWVNTAHLKRTVGEMDRLLPNRFSVLLTELVGLVLAPFILIFRMPESSRRIILFFSRYTRSDDGLGDVCSFAYFPLKACGDPAFRPSPSPPSDHLSGAKLERSFINFSEEYPSWKLPGEGEGLVEELVEHARGMREGASPGGGKGSFMGKRGREKEREGGGSSVIMSMIEEGGGREEGNINRGYDLGVIQESFFRPQKMFENEEY